MEPMDAQIGVYVKTDQSNSITDIGSSLFLPDTGGWLLMDEGHGDRYAHAQSLYLPGPVCNEYGIPNYKHAPGAVPPFAERTGAEKDADQAALPPVPPADTERLQADLLATQGALVALYEMLMGGQ